MPWLAVAIHNLRSAIQSMPTYTCSMRRLPSVDFQAHARIAPIVSPAQTVQGESERVRMVRMVILR